MSDKPGLLDDGDGFDTVEEWIGSLQGEVIGLREELEHERKLRQGLDRLGNTLFEERDQARAERDRLQAVAENLEGALRAIYADDPRAGDSRGAAYHAYRHRQGLARWALRQQGLVSRNDRSAQALITPVAGPTSPEYQQVVDRLFEMAEERDRLRAVVDANEWAGVVLRIMMTIDGGRRAWSEPIADQVVAAVADLEAERDRLRAVVWGETKMRAAIAGARSARDEATAERDRLRAVVEALINGDADDLTEALARLDVSGDMGGSEDNR